MWEQAPLREEDMKEKDNDLWRLEALIENYRALSESQGVFPDSPAYEELELQCDDALRIVRRLVKESTQEPDKPVAPSSDPLDVAQPLWKGLFKEDNFLTERLDVKILYGDQSESPGIFTARMSFSPIERNLADSVVLTAVGVDPATAWKNLVARFQRWNTKNNNQAKEEK